MSNYFSKNKMLKMSDQKCEDLFARKYVDKAKLINTSNLLKINKRIFHGTFGELLIIKNHLNAEHYLEDIFENHEITYSIDNRERSERFGYNGMILKYPPLE